MPCLSAKMPHLTFIQLLVALVVPSSSCYHLQAYLQNQESEKGTNRHRVLRFLLRHLLLHHYLIIKLHILSVFSVSISIRIGILLGLLFVLLIVVGVAVFPACNVRNYGTRDSRTIP